MGGGRALKAFERHWLEAGSEKEIVIELPPSAFWIWDVLSQQWIAKSGKYSVDVGGSLATASLHAELSLCD